ncbi:hypothetical protein ACWD4L_21200 [Streptomyces sp. NPDC002596]
MQGRRHLDERRAAPSAEKWEAASTVLLWALPAIAGSCTVLGRRRLVY